MNLPRPRFTVRRLMVAVAIVAVVLACFSTWRNQERRDAYLAKARQHEFEEDLGKEYARGALEVARYAVQADAKNMGEFHERIGQILLSHRTATNPTLPGAFGMPAPSAATKRKVAESFKRGAEAMLLRCQLHARLKHKFSLAAERPWLSVPPDPPEPE